MGEENTEFNAYVREVDPETICQYTGLIDNTKWEELFENEKQKFLSEWNRKEKRKNTKEDWNGRKIFENDFVSCRQYIGENHVDYCYECGYVKMKYGAFGLHREQGYYRSFKDWLEGYEYEIIGNIFDNPELLNGEMT